ncbi:MAG TPA: hypothetical protein ENK18_25910 [Deltaproteobacteria bacterium]|nr:hypothetical protein [Deltaproteobacteria bacterium]
MPGRYRRGMEPSSDPPPTNTASDLSTALWNNIIPGTPNRSAVGGFVGGEVLSGVAGWSAGLAGSWLVGQFFVARGIRNLWGLAARGDRTVVSPQTYEWLGTISEYVVGLVVLLLVQHVIGGTLREYAALRRDRGAPAPAPAAPSAPGPEVERVGSGASGPDVEPDDRR